MDGQWKFSQISRCCPSGENVIAQFIHCCYWYGSHAWCFPDKSVETITTAWNKAVKK